jgi:hypothetical protein
MLTNHKGEKVFIKGDHIPRKIVDEIGGVYLVEGKNQLYQASDLEWPKVPTTALEVIDQMLKNAEYTSGMREVLKAARRRIEALPKSNQVYLCFRNSDQIEGRGPMVEFDSAATLEEAKAKVKGQGVMGYGDGDVGLLTIEDGKVTRHTVYNGRHKNSQCR